MALSRTSANAIIAAVEQDRDCLERIRSIFGVVPAGYAGAVRNSAMMAANAPWVWPLLIPGGAFLLGQLAGTVRIMDLQVNSNRHNPVNLQPTTLQERYACMGIAEATRDAINAALPRAKDGDGLALIQAADHADRWTSIGHAATGITMRDSKRYIFDWHCTLRIDNPMIFPSQEDWDHTASGVLSSTFTGFA